MEALCCFDAQRGLKIYSVLRELLEEIDLDDNIVAALDNAFFYLFNGNLNFESKRFILRFIFYVFSKYCHDPLLIRQTVEEETLFEKIIKDPNSIHSLMFNKRKSLVENPLLYIKNY